MGRKAALMTAIVPQPDVFPEATVRRLVDDLMAHLAALPDHRDRRGRVHPLASLLAIHLLAELQPLVVRLAAACAAAESGEAEEKAEETAEASLEGCAVDGKSVRRSGDADRGLARPHIVSARLDNGLTVG